MAAGAVGENATLEVAEDGTASLEVELKALNLYGMTGAAKDLKSLSGNDTKSETKDVTVEKTDEAGNPTKIKFTIPESAKTTDGIYLHMMISPIAKETDAFLKVDYASLKEMKTYQMEQKKIRFILHSSVDTILKQLLHTKMEK